MKALSVAFAALAILLGNIMCAAVAYHYCDLAWEALHAGYSAPPQTAFVLAIPFGVGIAVCAVLALLFRKKAKAA